VCGGGGGCNAIVACDDLIADECIFEACLLNIFALVVLGFWYLPRSYAPFMLVSTGSRNERSEWLQ
jgi:hypothetical protein